MDNGVSVHREEPAWTHSVLRNDRGSVPSRTPPAPDRRYARPMHMDLRPNCECCDRDLPNGDPDARICTYECTFCADCAENRFANICPNCGGDLVRRPIRPPEKLLKDPAATDRFTKAHPECVA